MSSQGRIEDMQYFGHAVIMQEKAEPGKENPGSAFSIS